MTCPKCQESRDFADFAIDRSKASGRKSHCKTCDNAKARRWYEENRLRKRAYYMARTHWAERQTT